MIRAAALVITLFCVSVARADEPIHIQLIGLNDFHGQLGAGKTRNGRAVGGASVLAAYVRREVANKPSLIVHAGDWVGASPPESGLLQDEPSIDFLAMLGDCTRGPIAQCNVVGTPGNHEFDEGVAELLRLLRGGNHRRGPFLDLPWRGARVSYVSANVVDRAGKTILPPYAIKLVGGVKVGVIGATLREAPSMVVASGVSRVRFLAEAEAINAQVHALQKRGVHTLVVTIHQGFAQTPYEGPTRADASVPDNALTPIVRALDDDVDVVISGHAHAFTNALLRTAAGKPILVTQALSSGQALSVIELAIAQGDVIAKSARVLLTYADEITPASDVEALVQRAQARVAPLTAKVVGHAPVALSAALDAAGNSILGNTIADAQRAAVKADVALMNRGGIRHDLPQGDVTWGQLFALQPFGNVVMALDLTGAQLKRALEQQGDKPELVVSGIRYVWDERAPIGARVVELEVGARPLDPAAHYRVAVNNFLAEGGSGFTVFREAAQAEVGPVDLDALVAYLAQRGGQFPDQLELRVTRR
jgi:5'-nucleotidase